MEKDDFADESDDVIKQTFDFYALKKLKSREKKKLTYLSIIIIILLIVCVTLVVLYMKSTRNVCKMPQTSARRSNECVKDSDCHDHAYCAYYHSRKTCLCDPGYIDTGIDNCKDVSFAINFKERTTKSIPQVSGVNIPETTQLSVCAWYKLNVVPDGWRALFMFESYDIPAENDFMIWFHINSIAVTMRNIDHDIISKRNFTVKSWNHFCWTWMAVGQWKLFFNGYLYHSGVPYHSNFLTPFPKAIGTFVLGQDIDNDKISDANKMFEGSISGLYMYKRALKADEVMHVYEGKPVLSDLLIGWWQFKGKANSSEIVEEPHFKFIPLMP